MLAEREGIEVTDSMAWGMDEAGVSCVVTVVMVTQSSYQCEGDTAQYDTGTHVSVRCTRGHDYICMSTCIWLGAGLSLHLAPISGGPAPHRHMEPSHHAGAAETDTLTPESQG